MPDPAPSRPRSPRLLIAWLLPAWIVPLLLHVLRLDVLVLALLLVGTGSLLRSGSTLLDRLFLAGVALAGGLLSAGWLFSLWPWGLSPVPVGGSCLTVLVLIGFASRRRPELPLRVRYSDLIVLGSGVLAFVLTYRPLAGLPAGLRLAYSTTQVDRLAHYALFVTIRRVGGYTFLHQSQSRLSVQTPTEAVYPQGSHFLLALFDGFGRTGLAGVPDFSRYFDYVLIGYALLIASVVWAARWIAGAGLAERWRVVGCLVVAVFALFGALPILLREGFDSEIFGLVFVVLAAAITVRPLRASREQLVLAGAVTIAVFYTYNLFGAITGLALVLSLLVYRNLPRVDWRFAAIVLPVAAFLAVLPSAIAVLSGFDAGQQSLAVGGSIPLPHLLVPVLAVLSLVPLLHRRTRRDRVWRGMAAQLAVLLVIVGAFGAYQQVQLGSTGYYFDKLLSAGYVICLAGLGTLLLPVGREWKNSVAEPPNSSTLLADWPVSRPGWRPVAVAGALVLALAGAEQQALNTPAGRPALRPAIPLLDWTNGHYRSALAPQLAVLSRARLLGDGVASLAMFSSSARYNSVLNYFLASFNGDLGQLTPAMKRMKTPVPGVASKPGIQQLDSIASAIAGSGFPIRILVQDRATATKLRALLASRRLRATVVLVPAS
ncbi:MAG: hypothetical protein M3Y42_13600 [Actinomycetota bacterium]|nr:hypothetical protein [Actinomycetota bacterium]MDQ2957989.1 hypothetical protein [Actinomycetota bacterium]